MQLKNDHSGDKVAVVHDEVDSIPTEISPSSTSLPNQCEKCNKVFTRKNILKAHITKCKGIRDMLVCEYCNKSFNTYPSSRYRHYKICPKKAEAEKSTTHFG